MIRRYGRTVMLKRTHKKREGEPTSQQAHGKPREGPAYVKPCDHKEAQDEAEARLRQQRQRMSEQSN